MSDTMMNEVDIDLDATGLGCPLPILKTRKTIKGLTSGTVLRVRASDHGSVKDFESFCNQTGNVLVSSREDAGTYEFLIRIRGNIGNIRLSAPGKMWYDFSIRSTR